MSVRAMTWVWSLELPASQKLVMLALADHANDEGKCWPGLETVADKCGMTSRNLVNVIKKLEQGGYLSHEKRYADNGHRMSNLYQLEMGDFLPSVSKVLKHAKQGLSEKISHRLCEENDGLSEKISGTLEPITKPSIKNNTSKNKFSDDDMKAAKWIFSQILHLLPNFKQPNLESWANDVRLMVERDKRTHKEVCELFQWANRDSFWQANVLSPATLRKQWDKLTLQSKKSQPGKAATKSALKSLMDEAV